MAGTILAAKARAGGRAWLRWHADTTKTVQVQTGSDANGNPTYATVPDPAYVQEGEWERLPGETAAQQRTRIVADAQARAAARRALLATASADADVPALVGTTL